MRSLRAKVPIPTAPLRFAGRVALLLSCCAMLPAIATTAALSVTMPLVARSSTLSRAPAVRLQVSSMAESELKAAFYAMDADASGEIDRDELEEALDQMGMGLSKEQAGFGFGREA